MPYCSNCGNPVRDTDSFCQNCGNRIVSGPAGGYIPEQPTPTVYAQAQTISPDHSISETILAIVPDLMHNRALGMKDCYYLMVTNIRSLFIKITEPVMQKAAIYNQQLNPNQDKNLWSRWKAQVIGPNLYLQYLNALSPEQALKESPESFTLGNDQIFQVKYKYYFGEDTPSEWHLEFQTGAGSHKFVTGSNPEKLLKAAYSNKFSK